MPPRSSYGQGEVSAKPQDRHVQRVRWVLNQVWNEFYARKPKINVDLTREKSIHIAAAESSTQGANRWASHNDLQIKYADHVNAIPKVLPSLGPGKLGPSVAIECGKNSRSLKPKAKAPKSGRSGPMSTYPPYTYCQPAWEVTRAWHDFTMSFVPMLENDVEEAKWGETFKSSLWDQHGLDPDCTSSVYKTPMI
jgi:hypothetical protein